MRVSGEFLVLAPHALLPDVGRGPAIFAGDSACLTLGLLTALPALRPQQPLLIVDGANAFDPFLVADLARKFRLLPEALLDEIRISRVFTCHQLEALLHSRLGMALRKFHAKAVYFSGLLDPLLDEDVPRGEAARILRLIPAVLRRLSASGVVVLCACPNPLSLPGREEFFPWLCRAASWVFHVRQQETALQITCSKPSAGSWTWVPQIGLMTPRRWW